MVRSACGHAWAREPVLHISSSRPVRRRDGGSSARAGCIILSTLIKVPILIARSLARRLTEKMLPHGRRPGPCVRVRDGGMIPRSLADGERIWQQQNLGSAGLSDGLVMVNLAATAHCPNLYSAQHQSPLVRVGASQSGRLHRLACHRGQKLCPGPRGAVSDTCVATMYSAHAGRHVQAPYCSRSLGESAQGVGSVARVHEISDSRAMDNPTAPLALRSDSHELLSHQIRDERLRWELLYGSLLR